MNKFYQNSIEEHCLSFLEYFIFDSMSLKIKMRTTSYKLIRKCQKVKAISDNFSKFWKQSFVWNVGNQLMLLLLKNIEVTLIKHKKILKHSFETKVWCKNTINNCLHIMNISNALNINLSCFYYNIWSKENFQRDNHVPHNICYIH